MSTCRLRDFSLSVIGADFLVIDKFVYGLILYNKHEDLVWFFVLTKFEATQNIPANQAVCH